MGLLNSSNLAVAIVGTLLTAVLSRIFYHQYLHPLSKFPGPWYATSFSLFGALVSVKQKEPEFFMYLVRKYGSKLMSLLLFLAVLQDSQRYPAERKD